MANSEPPASTTYTVPSGANAADDPIEDRLGETSQATEPSAGLSRRRTVSKNPTQIDPSRSTAGGAYVDVSKPRLLSEIHFWVPFGLMATTFSNTPPVPRLCTYI